MAACSTRSATTRPPALSTLAPAIRFVLSLRSLTLPARPTVRAASLTYTRDGKALLYTGIAYTGPAGLVDVASGTSRLVFDKHTNTVTDGQLSADGKLAVSIGGDENEAFVWKTADGSVVRRLAGAGKPVLGTAWSRDGKSIAWGNINRANREGIRPIQYTFRLTDFQLGGRPMGRFLTD